MGNAYPTQILLKGESKPTFWSYVFAGGHKVLRLNNQWNKPSNLLVFCITSYQGPFLLYAIVNTMSFCTRIRRADTTCKMAQVGLCNVYTMICQHDFLFPVWHVVILLEWHTDAPPVTRAMRQAATEKWPAATRKSITEAKAWELYMQARGCVY